LARKTCGLTTDRPANGTGCWWSVRRHAPHGSRYGNYGPLQLGGLSI